MYRTNGSSYLNSVSASMSMSCCDPPRIISLYYCWCKHTLKINSYWSHHSRNMWVCCGMTFSSVIFRDEMSPSHQTHHHCITKTIWYVPFVMRIILNTQIVWAKCTIFWMLKRCVLKRLTTLPSVLQMQRIAAMKKERERQYKAGERSKEDHYAQAPRIDAY